MAADGEAAILAVRQVTAVGLVGYSYIGPNRRVGSVGASRSHAGIHRVLSGRESSLAIFGPMARSFQLEAWRDRTQVRPSLAALVFDGFGWFSPLDSQRARQDLRCAAARAMAQPRDNSTAVRS
jgi:hypothetical protein